MDAVLMEIFPFFAVIIIFAVILNLIGFFAFKKVKFKAAKIVIVVVYSTIYGVPTLWSIYSAFSSYGFCINVVVGLIIGLVAVYSVLFLSTTVIIVLIYLVLYTILFLKKVINTKLIK